MSLYRQVTFTEDDAVIVVPSGQLAVSRFVLLEDQTLVFSIQHAEENSQDLSLRAWISETPGGSPMEANQPQTWHPRRTKPELIGLMTEDAVYPDIVARTSYGKPGAYFINVLNLIHTQNKFTYSMMDGSSFAGGEDGESHNCEC